MDDGGIYRGYLTDLGSHQYIIVRLDTGQSIVSEMRRWTLTTKCGSLSDWNTLLSWTSITNYYIIICTLSIKPLWKLKPTVKYTNYYTYDLVFLLFIHPISYKMERRVFSTSLQVIWKACFGFWLALEVVSFCFLATIRWRRLLITQESTLELEDKNRYAK